MNSATENSKRVSIFGLGYVGCVTMGCLAGLGHQVTGVDIDSAKVELINQGKATIVEKDIDDLIEAGRLAKGLIKATADPLLAVAQSEIALVCVATPNDAQGHLDADLHDSILLGRKGLKRFASSAEDGERLLAGQAQKLAAYLLQRAGQGP